MQAAAVEINNGTYIEASKLTVSQWMDIWKREYLGHLKPKSLEVYEMHIETYITFRKPGCFPITIPKQQPMNRAYIELVAAAVKQYLEEDAK